MTKKEAGRLGGQSTFRKYGKSWMSEIGHNGATALHLKYRIMPIALAQYALVHKITGEIKATF